MAQVTYKTGLVTIPQPAAWPPIQAIRAEHDRKLRQPALPDVAAYQDHLEAYPGEWAILDGLCRITVTRFHRDRRLFGPGILGAGRVGQDTGSPASSGMPK
jgi:hypothetical protein